MTQEEFRKRYEFNLKTDNIGGGSFGTVYKAYDNVLDREVAIKVSEVKNIGDKEFSLLEEYKAIENLSEHQNIANYEKVYRFESFPAIYDYGIMQYYALGNLSHYLKNNDVSLAKRESITTGILEGIAFLHQHKVVHRDLKPSNILVVDRRGEIIPKITDFGLSKQAEADGKASRFTNSFAGGTLQYSSPEQLKGLPLKLNTDLWSFGAIAYEILTGKTLFEVQSQSTASAEWQNEITQKILHADVSKELEILPLNWRAVVSACLEKDVNNRVQNSTALFSMLSGNEKLKEQTVSDAKTVVKEPKKGPNTENKSSNSNNNDDTIIKGKEAPPTPKPTKEPQKLKTPPKPPKKRNPLVYVIPIVLLIAVALFLWKPWVQEITPLEVQTYNSYKEKAVKAYQKDSLEVALNYYKEAEVFMVNLEIKKANELLVKEGIKDSIISLNNSVEKNKEIALNRENDAWENAKKTNTTSSFNSYLEEYPNGLYEAKAKENILKLEKKKLNPAQLKKHLVTYLTSSINDNKETRVLAMRFLSLQSKLTTYKLLLAVYSGNKANTIQFDFMKLLRSSTNKSKEFLENKELFEVNNLSRKRLSQILPYLKNDINRKMNYNSQFDKESFHILNSDIWITNCLGEGEYRFTSGQYDNRFIKNHNSARSLLNSLRIINDAIANSGRNNSEIRKQVAIGIKKVNNDIYKLLKTLNMDSETRRLFNTSIINNGRDKLVNDSFKSLFYDAMTNATGFYRFRFLKYGNVKLDVLE